MEGGCAHDVQGSASIKGVQEEKREYKEVDMNKKKSAAYFYKIKNIGERSRE